MTTIGSGIIRDGLACRLAAHYAPTALHALTQFYWTGYIRQGLDNELMALPMPARDSRGSLDQHAIAAEKRALAHYLAERRGVISDAATWNMERRSPEFLDSYYNDVVAWAWQP